MSENLKDILSNLNPDIDQETLLLYLQGKLTPEKQHELEKKMMDDDFETDAMEGLQQFSNKKKLEGVIEQLNRDLRKKTDKKKNFRKKLELKQDPLILVTVLIILALMVISFVVLFYLKQR
jgi:hypothetical protein